MQCAGGVPGSSDPLVFGERQNDAGTLAPDLKERDPVVSGVVTELVVVQAIVART